MKALELGTPILFIAIGVWACLGHTPSVSAKAASPNTHAGKPVLLKRAVSYAKDVAPILYKSCSSCHHPGSAAPFSLLSYQDAAKRAELIEQVTTARVMPPWQPAPSDCPLADDISLSTEDLSIIKTWAATGKKAGKASETPKPPTFTPGWKLRTPDLVASMPKPFNVPADGPDIYRNFVVPLHLDHDVWVKTLDFKPGNKTVVHHSLFFFDTTGGARKLDGQDGQPGFSGGMPTRAVKGNGILDFMDSGSPQNKTSFGGLGGWAVGAQPVPKPGDYAYFLPAGSDLIMSTHFHPDGKPETETSTIGIYYASKPPSHAFIGLLLPVLFGVASGIKIPAGSKDFTIRDEFTLPVETKLISVAGHAHYLAKTFSLTAQLPDGTTKNVFSVPNWDFNWQSRYNFAPEVKFPAGTKLTSVITYDNTAENPHNPTNPPKFVTWGEQTTDEMGTVMLEASADTPEQLANLKRAYLQHLRVSFQVGLGRGRKAALLQRANGS